MGDTTPPNPDQELQNWIKKDLALKLEDWGKLTKNVQNHDCGLIAFGAFSCVTSGFFLLATLSCLTATLGSRTILSVEQQAKLDHLYDEYSKEIKTESSVINSAANSNTAKVMSTGYNVVSGIGSAVTGVLSTFSSQATSSAPQAPVEEPKGLRILKVIGPYLSPEKVTVWDCPAEQVPQPYRTEMNKLGIYHASEENLMKNKGMLADYNFKTANNKNTYTFSDRNPSIKTRAQRFAHHSLYGHNGIANVVLSPVGYAAGAVVEGATSFFKQKTQEAMPAITDAATNAAASTIDAAIKLNSSSSNKKK